MATTKKVFKVFWAWQDNNEEKWLNQMARKGWALKSYKFLYTFEKIEPTNYTYKLDYKANSNEDLDEYKLIFQDSGWEYVTQYGAWHYFRTIGTEDESLEIYTENEYQIEKYSNLLKNLIGALIALIILTISTWSLLKSALVSTVYILLLAIISVCIFKVREKISRLRE